MRVSLVQTNIVRRSPEANFRSIETVFSGIAPHSDLYVLPEMFPTGFVTEPEGIAESDMRSLEWMKNKAAEHGCAIAGSVMVEEDGRYYNRLYFVRPNRTVVHYDKRHLFSPAGENLHYTPGRNRVIVEYMGIRFLLLVCYDLRFPVWIRNRGDYDAILIVASWPDSRRMAWDILLKARAIENQCYVIAVNRQGSDSKNFYSGGSYIINPLGEITVAAPDANEKPMSCITYELDISDLETKYRLSFPVLKDGDDFELTYQ